ncbi:MAG: Spy/CpxP family protein refolding chaperone [Hydrotalea sp.]|nr:Spy/CpxP family protein refolding chaperone [Hydrotalea sp.]
MKKNFWSLVFSKHTLISVVSTLAVVIAVVAIGCGVMRNHFRDKMKNPEAMVQHKVDKMARKMDLNDSQVAQIKTFMLADFQTMKSNREAMMEKRKSQMKSVLTPEQYARWEEKMEKRMKKWSN